MTLTIDASLLSAYYDARTGVGAAPSSKGAGAAGGSKAPTPPWSKASTAPQISALTKAVLAGGKFFDPNATKIDAAGVGDNYKKLFGLYQGLDALGGLVDQMSATTLGPTEKARIGARFADGLGQLNSYLDTTSFDGFKLAQGGVAPKAQTTSGVKRETDTYTTAAVHTGAAGDPVDAFQGSVVFSLAARKPSGAAVNVAFDLAEMGSTPRTMANVVLYLNDKLASAGLFTRFANVRTVGQANTATANGQSVALQASADSFALQIKGVTTEALNFSAPSAAPAVYLAETSGAPAATGVNAPGAAKATVSTPATATRDLLKISTDPASGATDAANGKVFESKLGAEVQAVRATATAPDGSLYVLADVNAQTGGQVIKGVGDVALRKYDSAGNLVYTRTLGAAHTAAGYALAVSADGSRVAVGGSVTGALDSGDAGADPASPDSFVSVFDAQGQQVWSRRQGAVGADQVAALSFGADGVLYATGATASAMPGASALGGQDAYVQGFAPATDATGATSYSAEFTVQYGTSGMDKPAGVALSGSSVVVAGVENGHAVVRRYDLQPTGAPVLGAVRDLGLVQGGGVAGLGIDSDGSVVVAGSTHNGALSAGTVTTAYAGTLSSVFVAKLSANLVPSASERLTYYNASADLTASAMTVSGAQVFVAGQTPVAPPAGQTAAFDAFAARIDPDSGGVTWSQTYRGSDRQAAPTSIAVDATGASVLDRLGLPRGTIDYTGSQQLVADTSVRAGDQFYLRSGSGAAKAVTIETADTLKTLADKVNRALGFTAKVEVVNDAGYDRLKITPLNARTPIEIEAGKSGRNALSALGLSEGLLTPVGTATGTAATKPTNSLKASYGLQLPSTLNLDTSGNLKQAKAQLLTAISVVRSIYHDMVTPPAAKAAASGPVPAYLTAQIANYQSALSRLTGGG